MRSSIIVLLDERRARAAVAWPFVTRHKRNAHDVDAPMFEAFPGCWYRPEEWMGLAGLSRHDHDHVAPFLFRADVVGADGSVSAEAQAYARRLVARQLGGRGRRED